MKRKGGLCQIPLSNSVSNANINNNLICNFFFDPSLKGGLLLLQDDF